MDHTKLKHATVVNITKERIGKTVHTVEHLYYGAQEMKYRISGGAEIPSNVYFTKFKNKNVK